ncbi:glycosyltransferase family 4 protein [Qipengyuania sp. GH1]|uniref:glycosyltransferase family 4 protein n=1 Tax=Qipengyuania aestuarii TaxID=2867241 RepID=UPI001C884C18|nr:glycosyltransferase family 4 protein [Qipengyuania aestuarii]MBX7535482.1 glycosyltransferase family 4 protein [Qipengyuania aestuarii]
MRFISYEAALRDAGVTMEVMPLFSDEYIDALYGRRSKGRHAAAGYARRLGDILSPGDNDLLWIQSEALPWVPWAIEQQLLPARLPRVIDCDDAIFHRYDSHSSPIVRKLLGRKIDSSYATASLVTAGNSYLAERARAAGAPNVEIVPTVVDLDRYPQAKKTDGIDPPVIGWIGTPNTWAEYIEPKLDLLQAIARENGATVRGIGAPATFRENVETIAWSEETEGELIADCDIGIMPLSDAPFARGKCGYKLIQFMACGLPVIASPVGVNSEIVEHGVNGFLAETDREWADYLRRLASDPELRLQMGVAGRKKVESEFSLQVWGARLTDLLVDAVVRNQL